MNFSKEFLTLFTATIVIIQFGCDRVFDPLTANTECNFENATIEFLGFDDKLALRMALEEPYLYVCAGSDGVWKRDISNMGDWQFLGLQDSSLGKYTNVGAIDIDVLNSDILVAYNGAAPHVAPESTVSVWRSTNGGMDWFRSDSGIPESIEDPFEYNILTSLQRSPHQPNIIIGCIESIVYRSTNNGSYWTLLTGVRGVVLNRGYVRWHPFRSGEVWFFGTAGLFYPYCFSLRSYGRVPKTRINFDSLGFPSDGDVYDVAFNAGNPDIVYAATSLGVIKSADGGYTWRKDALRIPDYNFVFQMAHHPSVGGILYLAGGKQIYATCDGGKTVRSIGEVDRGFITSLVLDIQGNQLFIGTTEGGIYALKFSGR
ncbi:MAG: hypothetical protein WAN36_06915 [Calditrichia bacterium]